MKSKVPMGDLVRIFRDDELSPEFLRASIKRVNTFVFCEQGQHVPIKISLENYDLELSVDSQDGLKSLELQISPKLLARILEEYGKQLARSGARAFALARLGTLLPQLHDALVALPPGRDAR